MPSDGSADKSGTFECNRRADSYESKTVSFPSDFSCEQCILQYTWTTPNATYYGCADITVLPNQTKECPAVCLNGGVCSDGICLCVKSYYGPQCENKKNRDFAWLLLLLLSMLLLALGIGAISLLSSGKKEETKRLIGNENEMSMQDLRKEKPDPVVEREAGRKRDRPGELIGDACHNGHPLYLTKSEEGCPAGAFSCTNCGQVKKCNLGRWICDHCPVDYCTTCKPVKEMGGQRGPREEEKSGRPKDTRMAPDGMDDDLVRKVISSDQVQNIPQHRAESANGKIVWLKTHFIFMIDCSGSMKGSRWDSVKFGFNACLERLVPMKEVIVTGLTFDNKANLFCRECPPDQAIRQGRDMPFTGTGTNYKRCLEYAMGVITKTSHVDYLICMILLSDGLGGYPDRVIEELKDLKEQGKKFLFYSVACETEDDGDLMRMATELKGEHFKVESAEGIKKAFTNILGV